MPRLRVPSNKKHTRSKYRLRVDVYLPWEIMESEAWSKLNATAIRVLIRLLQKRKWDTVRQGSRRIIKYRNDNLVFTYAEAESLGIKNTTFYESINLLIDVGFIDVKHQGGAFARDPSQYAISERWRDYGTEDFKCVEKKRRLRPGCDIQSNLRRKKGKETVTKTVLSDNRKTENTTEKRSEPLRESAVIGR